MSRYQSKSPRPPRKIVPGDLVRYYVDDHPMIVLKVWEDDLDNCRAECFMRSGRIGMFYLGALERWDEIVIPRYE